MIHLKILSLMVQKFRIRAKFSVTVIFALCTLLTTNKDKNVLCN